MPAFTYLKLDGIQGDSQNPRHIGEIEVETWQFHQTGSSPTDPTGKGATKASKKERAQGSFTVVNEFGLFRSLYLDKKDQTIKEGVLTHEIYHDGKLKISQRFTFKGINVETYDVPHGAGQKEELITYILAWDEMKRM